MKVLLDTSFLLPSLGIEVEETADILENIADYEIYYSRFSILECLWVVLSFKKKGVFDAKAVKKGLRSIVEGSRYKRAKETSDIFIEALELYNKGHNDLIDCILYSTALLNSLKFVTLDSELRKFVREKGIEYVLLDV